LWPPPSLTPTLPPFPSPGSPPGWCRTRRLPGHGGEPTEALCVEAPRGPPPPTPSPRWVFFRGENKIFRPAGHAPSDPRPTPPHSWPLTKSPRFGRACRGQPPLPPNPAGFFVRRPEALSPSGPFAVAVFLSLSAPGPRAVIGRVFFFFFHFRAGAPPRPGGWWRGPSAALFFATNKIRGGGLDPPGEPAAEGGAPAHQTVFSRGPVNRREKAGPARGVPDPWRKAPGGVCMTTVGTGATPTPTPKKFRILVPRPSGVASARPSSLPKPACPFPQLP